MAWGLDFSAEATWAIRGQPLHLRLALHTAGGEVLRADCIQADVVDGERVLSGPDVEVRLRPEAQEGRWTATLVTQVPITQSSQKVTVSAGCGQRRWRRYTLKALPSAEQASQLPPTDVAPSAPPSPDASGWWLGGGAAFALLGAGWAWRARRRTAHTKGCPTKLQAPTSPSAKPSGQIHITATTAPDKHSTPLLMRPVHPAATPPLMGDTDQAPDEQWPEVELRANALAAQGQWSAATTLVSGHVRSARRAHLMPYLKLLQLQRREGDRLAFDDTRALMEQNFKLHAPRWSGRRCSLPALEAQKVEQVFPEADGASVDNKPTSKTRRS